MLHEGLAQVVEYSAVVKCVRLKIVRFRSPKGRAWQIGDTLVASLLLFCVGWSVEELNAESAAFSEFLERFIVWLQGVIEWIMGNPAGLKLNKPLNHSLARFFSYHIYLWRTYITFLRPAVYSLLVLLRLCGLFGVSLQLALIADLLNVFAVHIYCFHIYAASGSGKTTLLNTIVGRNVRHVRVSGRVLVNGREAGRRAMTAVSAYVQQDDLFMGTLTVREHLVFQALLRLPSAMSWVAKMRRVDQVLFDLGLRKCRHTQIGVVGVLRGVSGGEAKRLAFASEVLTNPSLLFCDEPTSGLDSYMAESVVAVLQKMAREGKTVVCTIHQPASEIYAMFDRVLFLAEGRVAYFGDTRAALGFFESVGHACPVDYNPADFFIEALAVVPSQEADSRQNVARVVDAFERSQYGERLRHMVEEATEPGQALTAIGRSSSYKSSFAIQFAALLWRATIGNYRDRTVALTKVIQKLILGVFVGLLYMSTTLNQEGIQNINGALYFFVNQFTYPSLFGVITFLPADFRLVVREHHGGVYTVAAYYWAKALSYLPVYSVDGALLTLIAYYMIGLRPDVTALLVALLVGVLIEQVSCACGTALSALTPTFPLALSLGGPVLTLMSLTGGLYANVAHLPSYLNWLQYISWFRYGFEAFAINQWHQIGNISCNTPQLACTTTGDQVLDMLSFQPQFLLRDLLLLVVITFALYFIGYVGFFVRVLFQLQSMALVSLWRLFRGKKSNPLRNRVDSERFDTQQLFLGTLLFTVCLFLLPTILVYYVVFSSVSASG